MKKWKKLVFPVLAVMLLLLGAALAAAAYFWNSMLNRIGDAEETIATLSQEELAALAGTVLPETTVPVTTSPEETWPVVVSNENITNIMLVGQNYRWDEQSKLSDTMILCSINRETKTLTLVSILRDLHVPLPPYGKLGPGRNRINVCYALGSSIKGNSLGGMEMLALCVEQNFGVHVDHTVEANFDNFPQIIDAIGGIGIDLTEAEAETLSRLREFSPGLQMLNGEEALAYARIRKIDDDLQRTRRQRTVITSIIDKCRNMNLMDLYALAQEVLPLLITDMTNEEISAYVWEFLPMAKDLQLKSMVLPVDNETLPGSMWTKELVIYGYPSDVVQCDTELNGAYLREALGIEETAEETEG